MKDTKAELYNQVVYVKGDSIGLPHYKENRTYVLPGGKKFTDVQLIKFGYLPASMNLWERKYEL